MNGSRVEDHEEGGVTTDRVSGTIARVVVERGFFFIAGPKGDYFGHQSALENCTITLLAPGDRVSFTARSTDKGWRAEAIVRESGR